MGWYFESGIETQSVFDPILLSASAGTFLYLGTLHGLERCVMVERCCNLKDFSFVIIGFCTHGIGGDLYLEPTNVLHNKDVNNANKKNSSTRNFGLTRKSYH